MSQKYKLIYFDAKGRAEVARLLFVAAGKAFEDKRLSGEEWAKYKPESPLGSLPVLEVDGKVKISQSMAVNRYLAREFNLYGKGNLENTIVDEILDTCLDMFLPLLPIFFNKDEEEKKKQLEAFMKDKVPVHLGNLEKLLAQTGEKGFAVGKSLTVADLVLFSYFENCQLEGCLDKFPRLAENRKTIMELPRIKKYLAERKATGF